MSNRVAEAGRPRLLRCLGAACAATALNLLHAGAAHGQVQAEWVSPVSGEWMDASKWSTDPHYPQNNSPPGTSYDVLIGATGSPYTISTAMPLALDSLRLTSPEATVNFTGQTIAVGVGSLQVTNGAQMLLGWAEVTTGGDVLLSNGGHLAVGNLFGSGISANWTFDSGATASIGTAWLPAGSITVAGGGSVTLRQILLGVGAGNVGSMLIAGPGTRVRGEYGWHIGRSGGHATMLVTDGAVVTPGDSTLGAIASAGTGGGTGTLLITGGAQFTSAHLEAGTDGIQAGTGTIIIEGDNTLVHARAEVLAGATAGGGAGTIILNGGTLIAGTPNLGGSRIFVGPTGTLLIHGGALRQQSPLTVRGFLQIAGSGTFIGGGATIDGGQIHTDRIWHAGLTQIWNGGLLRADQQILVNAGFLEMFSGGRVQTPQLALLSGGRARVRSTDQHAGNQVLRVGGLSIDTAASSWLDLDDNHAIIDYAPADPSPLEDVRAWLASGYAGGSWNGAGIRSRVAAINPTFGLGYAESSSIFSTFPAMFMGQPVDNTAVLIRYTRSGDADLDGVVNLADFNRLAANFGGTSAVWSMGDFNYDGLVNLADFNRLAANFGLSASGPEVTPEDWSALASAVPEPATIGLLTLSLPLAQRRRRHAF